jgi:hypothetical protein
VRWEMVEAVPGEGKIEQDLRLRQRGGPSAEVEIGADSCAMGNG